MNIPQIMHRTTGPRPVMDTARTGSAMKWFTDGGELNATDNKDAMKALGSLMSASSSGRVNWGDPNAIETASDRAAEREAATAAYHDRSSSLWQETGAGISATIYQTAKREGFLRRFLQEGELLGGTIPRVQTRFQNVQMIVSPEVMVLVPQIVRQKYFFPPEYYVLGNIRVEERDIQQGASDILEDAYNRATEQMNVVEDRVLVGQLDACVGTNPLYILSGGATPSNIAAMRTSLITWGLNAGQWIISADYWTDIAGNAAAWGNLFDPVTRYELVQTGYLGTLFGMGVTTDGFRDPLQQVMSPNDCYILADAANLGAYTDRGPAKAVEQNQYADGIPGRGWFFHELLSTTVVNSRAVAKGHRA